MIPVNLMKDKSKLSIMLEGSFFEKAYLSGQKIFRKQNISAIISQTGGIDMCVVYFFKLFLQYFEKIIFIINQILLSLH